NQRTEPALWKSLEHFRRAVERDPNYALGYAGLAEAYNVLGGLGVISIREAHAQSVPAAMKALSLDDTLAEAHVILADHRMSYDWDWVAAEREFKRAFELNPGYATAHLRYARFLLAMGRLEESRAESQRARELDPLSFFLNPEKALEMDPNFARAH